VDHRHARGDERAELRDALETTWRMRCLSGGRAAKLALRALFHTLRFAPLNPTGAGRAGGEHTTPSPSNGPCVIAPQDGLTGAKRTTDEDRRAAPSNAIPHGLPHGPFLAIRVCRPSIRNIREWCFRSPRPNTRTSNIQPLAWFPRHREFLAAGRASSRTWPVCRTSRRSMPSDDCARSRFGSRLSSRGPHAVSAAINDTSENVWQNDHTETNYRARRGVGRHQAMFPPLFTGSGLGSGVQSCSPSVVIDPPARALARVAFVPAGLECGPSGPRKLVGGWPLLRWRGC
jgi:hypothetical protein